MSENTEGATGATLSWNDKVIADFHAGEQQIGPFERSNLLLLHTTGARSGQSRTSPVVCFTDDEKLFVIASAAGADHHPAWYHNLVANPRVDVEIWTDDALDTFAATATPADDAERERLFSKAVQVSPGFAEYQTKTDRAIPVVLLERV